MNATRINCIEIVMVCVSIKKSQKFCNILVYFSLQYFYHVTEANQAVKDICGRWCADMLLYSL